MAESGWNFENTKNLTPNLDLALNITIWVDLFKFWASFLRFSKIQPFWLKMAKSGWNFENIKKLTPNLDLALNITIWVAFLSSEHCF